MYDGGGSGQVRREEEKGAAQGDDGSVLCKPVSVGLSTHVLMFDHTLTWRWGPRCVAARLVVQRLRPRWAGLLEAKSANGVVTTCGERQKVKKHSRDPLRTLRYAYGQM